MKLVLWLDLPAVARFMSIYKIDDYLTRYYETCRAVKTDSSKRLSLRVIYLLNEIMAAWCLFAFVWSSSTTPEWNYLITFGFPSILKMPKIYYLEGFFFYQVINYFFYNFYITISEVDGGNEFLQMIVESKNRFLLGGATFNQLKKVSSKCVEILRLSVIVSIVFWTIVMHYMFILKMWPYHSQMSFLWFCLGLLLFHLILILFALTMFFFDFIGMHFILIALIGTRAFYVRTNQINKFIKKKKKLGSSIVKRYVRENIISIKFLNLLNVFVGVPFSIFLIVNGRI